MNVGVAGQSLTDLPNSLKELAANWPAEGRRIFLLDGKNFGGQCASTAVVPMNYLRVYLEFLFRADGVFRAADCLIIAPGNSQRAYEACKKELSKWIKTCDKVCRRRGLQMLRLMNTNHEYRNPRRPLGKQRLDCKLVPGLDSSLQNVLCCFACELM